MIAAPPPPTLVLPKPCYVSVQSTEDTYTTEGMTVSGAGYDPQERLTLTVDADAVLTGVTTADDGSLPPQALSAPIQEEGERTFTVAAVREADGAQRASTTALVTALAVRLRPKQARPRRRVRFIGRGFTDPGAIYAHYIRKNVLRRTVKLTDTPEGDCGTFSVRRRQFPFRPGQGVWRIQVDQHPDLTTDGPLVNLAVDVKRRPLTEPG